jgi:hypothetical protein
MSEVLKLTLPSDISELLSEAAKAAALPKATLAKSWLVERVRAQQAKPARPNIVIESPVPKAIETDRQRSLGIHTYEKRVRRIGEARDRAVEKATDEALRNGRPLADLDALREECEETWERDNAALVRESRLFPLYCRLEFGDWRTLSDEEKTRRKAELDRNTCLPKRSKT